MGQHGATIAIFETVPRRCACERDPGGGRGRQHQSTSILLPRPIQVSSLNCLIADRYAYRWPLSAAVFAGHRIAPPASRLPPPMSHCAPTMGSRPLTVFLGGAQSVENYPDAGIQWNWTDNFAVVTPAYPCRQHQSVSVRVLGRHSLCSEWAPSRWAKLTSWSRHCSARRADVTSPSYALSTASPQSCEGDMSPLGWTLVGMQQCAACCSGGAGR